MFCFVLVNNKINLICTRLTSRDLRAEVNDVIFFKDQLILKARYLMNLPTKMHRINAKNFCQIICSDFFHKINSDFDVIAPLNTKFFKDIDF